MIIIPMAGLSSRFTQAGYTLPKYMLTAKNKSLFEHAVLSFKQYFSQETFVFIIRNIADTQAFVTEKCHILGIKKFDIVTLKEETRGQAETVYLGLQSLEHKDESVTIFNIDTFRPDFTFPENLHLSREHYVEVFEGSGDNWSFVKPANEHTTRIVETAEKQPISNLCSTGLYHFASKTAFDKAYLHYLHHPDLWHKGELYIAPIYNWLIAQGEAVHYHLIKTEEVVFCGIPAEYEAFKHDH